MAGGERAVAMHPGARVGADETEAVAARKRAGDGRLAGARRPADPEEVF
jgi:hypothetical protein